MGGGAVHFKLHANDKQNLFQKDEKHRNAKCAVSRWARRPVQQLFKVRRDHVCDSSSVHTRGKRNLQSRG